MQAFYVIRCRASRPSDQLPKLRVVGSSPIARFSVHAGLRPSAVLPALTRGHFLAKTARVGSVELLPGGLLGTLGEVPVGAVDHLDRGGPCSGRGRRSTAPRRAPRSRTSGACRRSAEARSRPSRAQSSSARGGSASGRLRPPVAGEDEPHVEPARCRLERLESPARRSFLRDGGWFPGRLSTAVATGRRGGMRRSAGSEGAGCTGRGCGAGNGDPPELRVWFVENGLAEDASGERIVLTDRGRFPRA
jgi:hypothetical protein